MCIRDSDKLAEHAETDPEKRRILDRLRALEWGARLPARLPRSADRLAALRAKVHGSIATMLDPVGSLLQAKLRRLRPELGDLKWVAEGELTSVFAFRDPTFDRRLCIKTAREDEGEEAFLASLDVARRLSRVPNFIPVYDVDTRERPAHCVTEYIEGRSLRRLIEEHERSATRIDCELVHHVLVKLAFALRAAHRRDIVHRNVKPSNIRIDRHGEPFLSPTGRLSRHVDVRTEGAELDPEAARYRPPEWFRGDRSWERESADIYALGLVGYHMLRGSLPPASEAADELDDLAALRPDCPVALARTVMKMVAADRLQRYQHWDEVLAALMKRTADELTLVQHSWLRCMQGDRRRFFVEFYDHLFRSSTTVLEVFEREFGERWDRDAWPTRRQVNLLREAILQLFGFYELHLHFGSVPDELAPLQGIARQHARYGLEPGHFDLFGASLVAAAKRCDPLLRERGLGDDDPAIQAWLEVIRPGLRHLRDEVDRARGFCALTESSSPGPATTP